MPRFDGTGPRGEGPMTGRGEGHCAVRLPDEPGQSAYGYAGLQGTPVRLERSGALPAQAVPFARTWSGLTVRRGRAYGRGRVRGGGRGWRFARR
ncbi:MAG: hypothetical protein GWN58_43035 [Anaerolineae bacterium]|nr:hypothetical protein [Anaerolineae bacterium]